MEKKYLNDRQDFIEWKVKHTDYLGNLQAIEYDEKEPLSYPCILIENDEYNENTTPTTEETKYDENQVLEAQIEETGSITPNVVEEEKPIQNQKPTKQDIFNARLGIEPDNNKVDF